MRSYKNCKIFDTCAQKNAHKIHICFTPQPDFSQTYIKLKVRNNAVENNHRIV